MKLERSSSRELALLSEAVAEAEAEVEVGWDGREDWKGAGEMPRAL